MLLEEEIYFTVTFGVMFILNLVGNSLVCAVVICAKHLHNFTSFLLVNLAVGDLMVGTLCFVHVVLALIQEQLDRDYKLMCKALSFTVFTNAAASIYTVMVLAIDRYFSIVKPIQRRALFSRKLSLRVIPGIWLASVLVVSPMAFFLANESHSISELRLICWVTLPQAILPNVYKFILFALLYFLPMSVITVFYVKIVRHLWSLEEAHSSANQVLLGSRVHLTKVICSIIVVLNVSWLPWFVVELSVAFGWIRNVDVIRAEVVAIFALANSCANPIVYSLQSRNFRRHIWLLHKPVQARNNIVWLVSSRWFWVNALATSPTVQSLLRTEKSQGCILAFDSLPSSKSTYSLPTCKDNI